MDRIHMNREYGDPSSDIFQYHTLPDIYLWPLKKAINFHAMKCTHANAHFYT